MLLADTYGFVEQESGRWCAVPNPLAGPAPHWRAAAVRTFVLGEERGLAARALRAHLVDHRSPEEP